MSGGWPERENVNANRLQEIIDMYKVHMLIEKNQKKKTKRNREENIQVLR